MKSIPIIITTTIMLFGCATSNELPPISKIGPSVAEEGSLANETLIADATAGLIESANIQADAKIIKFVIQQPVGSAGKELGVKCGSSAPRVIQCNSFLLSERLV